MQWLGLRSKSVPAPPEPTDDYLTVVKSSDGNIIATKRELKFHESAATGFGYWQYLSQASREGILKQLENLWITGWTDGERGQKQFNKEYLTSQAKSLQFDLVAQVTGELRAAERMEKELEDHHRIATERKKFAAKTLDQMNQRKQLHPSHYSWALMILFFVLGLLVFIADIPLALMITEEVFAFDATDPHHTLNFLFHQPEEDTCSGMLVHLLHVLMSNWRVVLLTMGVALCTLLFKILYDEFMLRPPDKAARELRLLALTEQDLDPAQIEKDIKKMRIWRWSRIGVAFLLLGLTIFTLFTTGRMRAMSEEHNRWVELRVKQQNAGGNISDDLIASESNTDTAPQAASDQELEKNVKDSFQQMIEKSNLFYLLITILFPLLAGIFFSYSTFIYLNKRLAFKTKWLYRKFKHRWQESSKTLQEAIKRKTTLHRLLGMVETPEFVQTQSQLLYLIYLHGYQRGVVNPGLGRDEYQRAKMFILRLMSARGTETIHEAYQQIKPIRPIPTED